eukprot:g3412.t1
MSSKRWDFKLESSESSGKSGTPDPSLGWRADDASVTATGAIKKPASIDKSFLDKKAWEAVMQPAQGVFMNVFMLWMMGNNPGIFGIMMLAYALTSSVAQLKNVNNVFLPFTQQNVDCSFQKIAYVLICLGVLMRSIERPAGWK